MKRRLLTAWLMAMIGVTGLAGELQLGADGQSDYQIVVPNEFPTEQIGKSVDVTLDIGTIAQFARHT